MKKEIIIIAGANGSGKTTFAKSFINKYPFEFISADEISIKLNPDDIESNKLEAGKIFFKKVEQFINENKSFAIESTLSGKYLLRLIRKVKEKKYSVKIIYIFIENPNVCIERIKERALKGGHLVPVNDIIRRYYRSKENFWKQYKEIVNEWILVYNSKQQFIQFAFGSKDKFIINNNEIFNNFSKDIK